MMKSIMDTYRRIKSIWTDARMRKVLQADGEMSDEITDRVSYFLRSLSGRDLCHTFILTDRSLLGLSYSAGKVSMVRSVKGGLNSDLYDAMYDHATQTMSLRAR